MEYMSIDKYVKLILKKWKIVFFSTVAFIVLAILFGVFAYSPTYVSVSKIMLKPESSNTYVTQLNYEDNIAASLGGNKNPILTQIEVINSYDLAIIAAGRLSAYPTFKDMPKERLASIIQGRTKLSNPPGTDIINVAVSWDNPVDAQIVAKTLVECYYTYNETLYRESILSTKRYIEDQLAETNQKLFAVREEIERYRKANSSVDVDLEAQSIIAQIARIENLLSDVNVNIASDDKKIKEIAQNLGVDLKKAVDAVALGQSTSIVNLNQTLNDNQQKLASLVVKYPDNNPQIRSLQSGIKEVKSQIQNETIALIGKKPIKGINSIIADSVRSDMVNEYVKNSIDLQSMMVERDTLKGTLGALKSSQNVIPSIQKTITTLKDKERTLSSISETLNQKLVEAKIKESAIVSNIDVIEAAILPKAQSFPSFAHIMFIFALVGFLLGVVTVLGLYYIEDVCEGASEVEEIIKAPVLGIIPWLTNTSYGNFFVDYNPHSVAAIIYQKIATSLKIKCYKKKFNCIALISSELEKRRSIVAASLASTLAKSGERVFLIDTDFRDGSLTREFNVELSRFPDITDCIMELSKVNAKSSVDEAINYNEIIGKYMVQIPGQDNLFLIPNNNKIDNPYEILNNDAFPKLMQALKSNFDLVIVDTPPMLAVADSIVTSQHVDGLVVLCGVKTARSNLRKIKKLCDENYVEILGAIARDTLTELEVPENMYIKQLSGKES